MSTPKKTKFRAIINLEEAIFQMFDTGFSDLEIKEITRDILKRKERNAKIIKESFTS